MISRITLQNFKSFKERTTIDLKRTSYKILEQTNVSKDQILKGALFVGGNATGKTNVVLSLKLLLELFFSDTLRPLEPYRCLFCPDSTMQLAYEFIISGKKVELTISCDAKKHTMCEKLAVDSETIIDRKGNTAECKVPEHSIYNDIPDDHLFIREVYFNTKFRGFPILQQWFDFLQNSVYVNPFLNNIVSSESRSTNLLEYLDEHDVDEINDFFRRYKFGQEIEFTQEAIGENYRIRNAEKKDVFFKRDGLSAPIPFMWESLGNQNLVKLLPHFLFSIENSGMLIIDEFSSGFHNMLEEMLVKHFMKYAGNSQMFMVSHSTNLLSNALLRPDQIYTVDFSPEHGSSVSRISKQRPREAQNLERMYLSGVFEGLPDFGTDGGAAVIQG